MQHLVEEVGRWAHARGIYEQGTRAGQYSKTLEEVGELGEALINDQFMHATRDIKDAIGDITVTLIIQAEMNGLTFEECLAEAVAIISSRKGEMVGGKFIKEEDGNV